MKKLLVLLVLFVVVSGSAFAFNILSFPPPVEGGNVMIDLGLGYRSMGRTAGLWVLSGAKWIIPPVFLQAEFALPVGVPISVGGMVTVCRYGWKDWLTYTDITIAARGNWHWGFRANWLDFYTGISLGMVVGRYESTDWFGQTTTGTDNEFFSAFQVGAHFYFAKNVGVVAEVGYPYWIKAGLALKF
jgi:hypothetical protein